MRVRLVLVPCSAPVIALAGIEGGRVAQQGTLAELADAPATALVHAFARAVRGA